MRNKLQEAFDQIEADSRLKESTKQFLQKERENRTYIRKRKALQRTLAAACVMLALVLGIGGYSWIQAPVSYVSIDVNPSIELALNRFDRVVSATAYNPEGEEILKSLSLKGKKYSAAIEALVESAAMEPYLSEDAELVLTVAAEENREQDLLSESETYLRHIRCSSFSVSADMAMVPAAHDNGLSLGKYYAYLKLAQYDETVTPDSCRDMNISTIHEMIEEHEHGSSHEGGSEHGHENYHGSGYEDLNGHHAEPEHPEEHPVESVAQPESSQQYQEEPVEETEHSPEYQENTTDDHDKEPEETKKHHSEGHH